MIVITPSTPTLPPPNNHRRRHDSRDIKLENILKQVHRGLLSYCKGGDEDEGEGEVEVVTLIMSSTPTPPGDFSLRVTRSSCAISGRAWKGRSHAPPRLNGTL